MRYFKPLILILLIALVSARCAKPANKETVKVGALLILSGDFAQYGERSKHAIEMAVEEYNKSPQNQKKIEVIYEDTKAEPKTAVSAYTKLRDVDHVSAIVGPLLQVENSAIAPLVSRDRIPVFSVSSVAIENRTNTSNPLVIWPDPTLEAGQMGEYIYNQGVRSVAVLGTQDSWENEVSKAFAEKFTALGGTVTSQQITLPDAKDERTPVAKAIQGQPQAVFLGTYYKFYPFIKTVKELGFKGKVYGIEIDTYLAEQSKTLSDGLQFISPDFYSEDFTKRYEAKYGEKLTLPAGQVFDATNIMLKMLKEHQSSEEILEAMTHLKSYQGVSGEIKFTEDHRATFPLSIFEIQNGNIIRLK